MVYRARDSKLKRDVAIKTLPRDVASDPERLARLDRLHVEAEQLFESILTRRLDKTAGMRAAGTRA